MRDWFRRFSSAVSSAAGSLQGTLIAFGIVLTWAIAGPFYRFSPEWQMVINTGTTIITFLMVFVIQNTQNRDSAGIHLKLDEIVKSISTARNEVIQSDDMDEHDIKKKIEDVKSEVVDGK